MKKTNLKFILSAAIALVICLFVLAGCGNNATTDSNAQLAGGVLCLKVNPEIAITYDADGNVTKVDARNDDAKKIITDYTGYEGKACKTVVSELVTAIGTAGYFVEEIEGESRQITIEIETGSRLPNNTFLDDVANEVRTCVNNNSWVSPVDVKGESDYGITDYVDTDYGPGNDGVTDYSNYGTTSTPSTSTPTAGSTDYDDTDYGPNNDGVTDYNDTDYGPNNDGVTDYKDSNYGNTNYGDSSYDDNGDSRYDD